MTKFARLKHLIVIHILYWCVDRSGLTNLIVNYTKSLINVFCLFLDRFLDANPEGKVPVIKDGGKFVADSDVIAELLEEKFPEPSLKTPEDKSNV